MGKWGNFMLWCWKSLPCVLLWEASLAVLCPLRWIVSPLVLREQPEHCLSHIPVSWGWVSAVLWPSVPHRMTPLMAPVVAQGVRVWVPLGGEQEVCGPLWWAQQRLHSPHQTSPATPIGLHCPGVWGAASLHQGSCSHSCQSLPCPFSYPPWFLKFTDLLLVSEWAIATPFLTPYPGWQ